MVDSLKSEELSLVVEKPDNECVQLVVFSIANREYALPVTQVVQILRMVALTPLPHAPAYWHGVINLRGHITPIMDLSTRFGLPSKLVRLTTRIIIVQSGQAIIGLTADIVSNVVSVSTENMETVDVSAEFSNIVSAIARLSNRLIPVLNIQQLGVDLTQLGLR